MGDPSYQVVLLGEQDKRVDKLKELVGERLVDLGLPGDALRYLAEIDAGKRDRRLPTIAVFFGYAGATDSKHPAIASLLVDSELVIPIVSALDRVGDETPPCIHHINALAAYLPDHNFNRVSSIILEGFRLLRRERRLFISYRRNDSQSVADQLYESLDSRGFDVFIDTRSVPPAADFQAELWHRLSDSDVVVLIDTPGFRLSRWTKEELARANATNIQILHVLWPGQVEDSASAFSHFVSLGHGDFEAAPLVGAANRLTKSTIETLCGTAEALRAKAIAARHRYLVDSFCDLAHDQGLAATVQPERWVSLVTPAGETVAVVPTIGVPTSERINDIFTSVTATRGASGGVWVLYDTRGLLDTWLNHLQWLDAYLPVKSIGMAHADGAIKAVL